MCSFVAATVRGNDTTRSPALGTYLLGAMTGSDLSVSVFVSGGALVVGGIDVSGRLELISNRDHNSQPEIGVPVPPALPIDTHACVDSVVVATLSLTKIENVQLSTLCVSW